MAFIRTIGDDDATPEIAELFEEHRAAMGHVPNYARLFAHRPAVYAAWSS
jgi:hypothetical protein